MSPTQPPERFGSRIRDGAVDPKPTDYLGPSNAGKAGEEGNPHGPNVINPGLPDEWPTYEMWRQHVIDLGLPDPGPFRSGNPSI